MKKTYSVEAINNNMRLDRYLRNVLGNIPQSFIEKNLRNGKIKINGKKSKSSNKVKTNDSINLYFQFKENIIQKKKKYTPSKKIIKENENLIIDNNDDFLVINKSSGVSVQGGTKSKKNLIDIFANSEFFVNTKPYSVHRLDKDTSGVFIIAKHRRSAQLLTSLFRLRKVHKTYLAICEGSIDKNSGMLKSNLLRYEKNKTITEMAITNFKVLDKNNISSLVEMKPITGRKHQLRKQLAEIGHPICGDQKYSNKIRIKSSNKNLMLHSYQIKFMINDQKYTYTAITPQYFKKFLNAKRLKYLNLK